MNRPAFRILPQEEWPAILHEHYSVAGVAIGGCVDGNHWFRKLAHAHTGRRDKYRGWICFLSPRRLAEPRLLIHELAHILTGQGHTDTWRRMVLQLGGKLEPHEHKRLKQRPTHSGLYREHHLECPCLILRPSRLDSEDGGCDSPDLPCEEEEHAL